MSTTLQLTPRLRPVSARLHPRCAWLPLLLLLTLTLSMTVQAQFNFTKANGAITITGYTGAGGDVTVPSTLEGLPVTSIGVSAFSGYTGLTNVTLPNSVISIRDSAFYGCTGLTKRPVGNDGILRILGSSLLHSDLLTGHEPRTGGGAPTNVLPASRRQCPRFCRQDAGSTLRFMESLCRTAIQKTKAR